MGGKPGGLFQARGQGERSPADARVRPGTGNPMRAGINRLIMKLDAPTRFWKSGIVAGICFWLTPFIVFVRFHDYPFTHPEILAGMGILTALGIASGFLMEAAGQYSRTRVRVPHHTHRRHPDTGTQPDLAADRSGRGVSSRHVRGSQLSSARRHRHTRGDARHQRCFAHRTR